MSEPCFAHLHQVLRYRQTVTTLACEFAHHVGQSKGGALSLLILVAILPHLLIAEVHDG